MHTIPSTRGPRLLALLAFVGTASAFQSPSFDSLGAPGPGSGPSTEGVAGVWQSTTTGFDAVLVLEERADGRLLGYLPATSGTRVTGGQRSGTSVTVLLAGEDLGASWEGTYSAALSGSTLTGTFSDGASSTALDFQRTTEVLVEERWAWFEQATSDQLTVARLEDASGMFVGGSFTAETSCEFLACGGQLSSWAIVGTSHTITTSSGGSCASSSTLTGDLTGTPALLTGTYTTTNCSGNDSGGFLGGKAGLVNTTQARELLQSLTTFTDQFEDESASAVEVFHSSYLHDGKTRADWSADFSAWWSTYEDISIALSVEDLILEEDGEVHPYLSGPPRLTLKVQAQGTHSTTGATEVFWDYSPELPHGMHLTLLGSEGRRRVLVGNGEAAPFSLGLPIAPTDHAETTYCIWPYGVHGGGHPEGHPGVDFEYQAGADVIAAAAGEVLSVTLNEHHLPDIIYSIIQEARPGVQVLYDEVANPTVTAGTVLAVGDVIGEPYDTGSFYMIHFGLRANGQFLSPAEYLNSSAQAQYDTFWSIACYQEEAAEPLSTNAVDVTFPLTRIWQRVSTGTGQSEAEVRFTRLDPTDYAYTYELVDSGGVTLEWGTASFNTNVGASTLQMEPDSSLGLPTRYGAYDIIGAQMWLDWDTTSAPPDLGGASLYETIPE